MFKTDFVGKYGSFAKYLCQGPEIFTPTATLIDLIHHKVGERVIAPLAPPSLRPPLACARKRRPSCWLGPREGVTRHYVERSKEREAAERTPSPYSLL